MFMNYEVSYKGKKLGVFTALSENSAIQKARSSFAISASAYSCPSLRDFKVTKR